MDQFLLEVLDGNIHHTPDWKVNINYYPEFEQPISAREKQYPTVWYMLMFDIDLRCLVRLAVIFGNSSTYAEIFTPRLWISGGEFFNKDIVGGLNCFEIVGTTLKREYLNESYCLNCYFL